MNLSPTLRAAFSGVVLVAAFAAAPALAQQPAAKPPVAAELQVSPSHVAVARDVIVASGMSRTFDGMVRSVLDEYAANILQTRKDLEVPLKDAIAEVEARAKTTEVANMQVAAAILLSKKMSEADLKEVLAFFKTPAGAAYIQMQPAFLDGLVVAIDGWSQRVMPKVVEEVRTIMNAKGYKL